MLPASYRLRKDADIKRVFAAGRGVYDDFCGLKYARNGMATSRLAVVVGLKVSKKAVDRNRLKRQIRAILSKKLKTLRPGFDVLFLGRAKALGKGQAEIELHIDQVLKKAKLCAT